MLKISVISVSTSSLNQDLDTHFSGRARRTLTWCREYSQRGLRPAALNEALHTPGPPVKNNDPAVCGPSLIGVAEHAEKALLAGQWQCNERCGAMASDATWLHVYWNTACSGVPQTVTSKVKNVHNGLGLVYSDFHSLLYVAAYAE